MKLATLRNQSRDGKLIVVKRDLSTFISAEHIAPNLQAALDSWVQCEPKLQELANKLERQEITGEPLNIQQLHAPLPRAYEWVDGSAYINHIILVRKARGAEIPATLQTDPLVYQGGSGIFLGPTEDIPLLNPEWGLDFESEVCVILGDTPQGVKKSEANRYVRLLMLANDITLRNLIPNELAKGFGFFNSKPATAFSPIAVTPDELGEVFKDGRVYLRLKTTLNQHMVGDVEAGEEMHFSFYDLIEHITKTRAYTAGTILGSGTVSNAERKNGISCLAEQRMLEIIDTQKATTPFLQANDTIKIEMLNNRGESIFGAIEQTVKGVKK